MLNLCQVLFLFFVCLGEGGGRQWLFTDWIFGGCVLASLRHCSISFSMTLECCSVIHPSWNFWKNLTCSVICHSMVEKIQGIFLVSIFLVCILADSISFGFRIWFSFEPPSSHHQIVQVSFWGGGGDLCAPIIWSQVAQTWSVSVSLSGWLAGCLLVWLSLEVLVAPPPQ